MKQSVSSLNSFADKENIPLSSLSNRFSQWSQSKSKSKFKKLSINCGDGEESANISGVGALNDSQT